MFEMLAEASATEIGGGIAAAVVLALGGREGIAALQSRRSRANGNGGYNKDLCDERHKQIDKTFERVEEKIDNGFTRIFDKLDSMHDDGPPRVRT